MFNEKITTILIFAFISGLGINTLSLKAQSSLLNAYDAQFTLLSFILSNVIFILIQKFLFATKHKFSKKIALSLIIFPGLVVLANLKIGFQSIFALTTLGFLASELIRWGLADLSSKNFSPTVGNEISAYSSIFYEIGTIIAIALLSIKSLLELNGCIYFFSAYCFIGAALISTTYSRKRYVELKIKSVAGHFSESNSNKNSFLIVFLLIIFLLGISRYLIDLYLRTELKTISTDSNELSRLLYSGYIVASVLTIFAGFVFIHFQKKMRLSPLLSVYLHLAFILIPLGIYIRHPTGFSFIAFFACFRASERFFFLNFSTIIASGFNSIVRKRIILGRQLFYVFIPSLIIYFLIKTETIFEKSTAIFVLVVFAAFQIPLLFNFLVKTLNFNMKSKDKATAILAVNLLSYLKPKSFVHTMQELLSYDPKKLLKKTIIVSLGFSRSENAHAVIMREFNSDKEEIQIAAIDALGALNDYQSTQSLLNVLLNKEHVSHSQRVRINAAKIIATLYGKKAIPFIMNGLEDENARIVANTLEVLATFKDRKLNKIFKEYLKSDTARVRANAMIGLLLNNTEVKECYTVIETMLNSTDFREIAAAMYAIGYTKNRGAYLILNKVLLNKRIPVEELMIKRSLAWALSNNSDRLGYMLFSELFDEMLDLSFLHQFSQLNELLRFEVLEYTAQKLEFNYDKLNNIAGKLKQTSFDFHEEIEYLNSLTVS